ncbi:hypothetical protein BKA70DRAFT_1518446 [Coprinopsis sp. MPI-PUGE-AT-0042]|nr:hypothetical protein BKA70DRAFT_1518446 [Coprinopsis sp. MPI-PUGE-AT-0042]
MPPPQFHPPMYHYPYTQPPSHTAHPRPVGNHASARREGVGEGRTVLEAPYRAKRGPGKGKKRARIPLGSDEDDVYSATDTESSDGSVKTSNSDTKPTNLDAKYYPQGSVFRRCLLSEKASVAPQRNKWAWRNYGFRTRHGGKVGTNKCLGAIICTNPTCTSLIRPKIHTRDSQKSKNCPLTTCQAPLQLVDCDARSYYWQEKDEKQRVWFVWEHEGEHLHPRPSEGRGLMVDEEEAVSKEVERNAGATVHQFRTGTAAPRSKPLHEIAPSLASPQKAQYHVKKSQEALGILNPAEKGAFGVLETLSKLNDDFRDFLVKSDFVSATYLMFQTQYMRDLLVQTVNDWGREDTEKSGRHGFVTDASHKFFRHGKLQVTCVWNVVVRAWVPVLLTWTRKVDEAHLKPHFEHIANQVVDVLDREGLEFKSEYLVHVMDFSQAQQNAHAEAYVCARVKHFGDAFKHLSPTVQEAQQKAWRDEALEAQRGCRVHFTRSALRIESTHALVKPEDQQKFRGLTYRLLDTDDETRFKESCDELLRCFPTIDAWLRWWLQPKIACMAFRSKSKMAEDIRSMVPETSNPVEHQHSLLNHAVGTQNDLFEGIGKLFKHINELEAQHRAVRDGHMAAQKPRERSKRKHQNHEDNDGRAPDTMERLASTKESAPSHLAPIPRNALYAYRWNDCNSCYWDNSLELWFRAFICWSEAEKAAFRHSLPSDSFLAFLCGHFTRREKLIENPKSSKRSIITEFSLGQTMTESCICDKWGLALRREFASVDIWYNRAMTDGAPPQSAMAHFSIQHLVNHRCSAGHMSSRMLPDFYAVHCIHMPYIEALSQSEAVPSIPIDLYFSRWVPMVGTLPLHGLHTAEACSHTACNSTATLADMIISWPKILSISLQITGFRSPPTLGDVVEIKDLDGSCITYELVGRVLHQGQHFTSQIRYLGRTFNYNDILPLQSRIPNALPTLREISNPHLFQEPHNNTPLFDSRLSRLSDSDYLRLGLS